LRALVLLRRSELLPNMSTSNSSAPQTVFGVQIHDPTLAMLAQKMLTLTSIAGCVACSVCLLGSFWSFFGLVYVMSTCAIQISDKVVHVCPEVDYRIHLFGMVWPVACLLGCALGALSQKNKGLMQVYCCCSGCSAFSSLCMLPLNALLWFAHTGSWIFLLILVASCVQGFAYLLAAMAANQAAPLLGDAVQVRSVNMGGIPLTSAVQPQPPSAQTAVQAQPIAQTATTVTCPAGSSPGSLVQIQTPDGRVVQVQIPDGVKEGEQFQALL